MGSVLGWLLAAGMALLGVLACFVPLPTSHLYGAPQTDANGAAWVRAAGLRDLALSAALAIFLAGSAPRAAAVIAFATALVAIGDFASVATLRGRDAWLPLSVHASGIAMGIASSVLLVTP